MFQLYFSRSPAPGRIVPKGPKYWTRETVRGQALMAAPAGEYTSVMVRDFRAAAGLLTTTRGADSLARDET